MTGRRTWAVVTGLAVLAVLGGGAGQALGAFAHRDVQADPPPALYPDALINPLSRDLAGQQRRAQALFASYLSLHPADRDEAGFRTWVVSVLPPPSPPARLEAERVELERLQQTRTPAGDAAATWLEVYGKTAIWKTYLKDVQETASPAQDAAVKGQLAHALDLADRLTKQVQATNHQSSPYVTTPALRPDKKVKPGHTCPCSYPSTHGALSEAAVTLLTGLDPHRADEYDWMAAQVGYSRLYAAGHYRSDLLTGALLGDLVGRYQLFLDGPAGLATGDGLAAAAK